MTDDSELLALCDTLDDLERARIAAENRLRSLRDVKHHEGSPGETTLDGIVFGLKRIEADATKAVEKAMKVHPLGGWVETTPGLGLKTVARMLAAVGNPLWNYAEDRHRRGVAEMWSYCGYGDAKAQVRRRGQKANWNVTAKMRTFLVAEACVKLDGKPDKNGRRRARSPFRDVYDAAREQYADATHDQPCVRCGPSGHPALVGSPLSDAHKHARALRRVAKEILKDLYRHALLAELGLNDEAGAAA